jgi:hypothetical protein
MLARIESAAQIRKQYSVGDLERPRCDWPSWDVLSGHFPWFHMIVLYWTVIQMHECKFVCLMSDMLISVCLSLAGAEKVDRRSIVSDRP